MTPLQTLKRRRQVLRRSSVAFEEAVREAVASGASKTKVAEVAELTRPTVDAILRRS